MKLDVLKLDGSKAGSVELDDAIFGVAPRADILHRVVRYQLAKRRAGTHDTQNRGEVSRTHTKFGKQKGSGGARHGSRNAPIFRGGGVAHGPHPRSYAHSLNKKVRALGMKMALSAKVAEGSLIVVDKASLDAPKTKTLLENFGKLGVTNALVIAGAEVDTNLQLAARNVPNVDVLPAAGLNVYDVLRRQKLVLSRDAIEAINARFASKGEAA
ncbi:50S ribosomal protein L4 [Candidatus Phycosocius bacilliformis]|uniref:Large ribosomal subunit protein uL4 n=1 Tax=Candidatus Phycosocius bacilliformis TaxID=1445552 RepID=A0A2P2EBT3_9PROT|nr:50S ribosomal protein L4 [Candidatus Phycosocius bacilliformis]GBF58522.1 50S ribosomal protein L4 [Candidatus Phycosocius bacilliformis]